MPDDAVVSRSQQIYEWLRNRILVGSIKPGELIDEKSITARFGVSRTPVREAVNRLKDEHLVDIVAQSATRASQLNPNSIREAFLIRRALEMESAAQAATVMSQIHADSLADIIEKHIRTLDKKEYAKAIEVDDEFHRYIAEMSGLNRLWRTIEISKAQLDRCRHIMLPRIGEAENTIEHHRRILRALNTGNAEKSRAAMQEHLDISYQSSKSMLDTSELSFPLEPKPGGRVRKAGPVE